MSSTNLGNGQRSVEAAPRTEAELLKRESEKAAAAMRRTVTAMQRTVLGASGLDSFARQRPWIATGSAAALGFLVGYVLLPARKSPGPPVEQDEGRRPSFLAQALAEPVAQVLRTTFVTAAMAILSRPDETGKTEDGAQVSPETPRRGTESTRHDPGPGKDTEP